VASLIKQIIALTPERGGLRRGEGLVIGLSGGADSIALCGLLGDLADDLNLTLIAAHLDHQLRDESVADLEFCREFCSSRSIAFVSASADVRTRARLTGEGIEAAGRYLRHAWLEEIRQQHDCDRIALAHHLDDHAETLLMWLGRGTGLGGLTGIEPARDRIVRPLREFRRETLRDECKRRGWAWREDASNSDDTRTRNRLRARVLPALEEALGPGSIERMGAMSSRAAGERAALSQFAAEFVDRTRIRTDPGLIEVERSTWQNAPQIIIFQALREAVRQLSQTGAHQRWNEARYQDVLEFIRDAGAGRQTDLPGGGVLEITRNSLILRSDPDRTGLEPTVGLELDECFLTRSQAATSFWGHDRASFDADRVHPPFTLRKVLPGDRMQPFGMPGHKRLTRLLADKAVARHDRPAHLVVEDRERIVWAVGLTTSEHTRITKATQRVLQLRIRTRPTDGKGPCP
jgi:tRNA(Ile)-lysidine synthase